MWSFFSRDPSKDLNYEIGELVAGFEDQSIWKLYKGKKKITGEEVSVFVFDIKNNSEIQLQIARASLKKLKTLRHPNFVTFIDALETDKIIYMVTEYVEPLTNHVASDEPNSKQDELRISWGLHQIIKGINFLNTDCNLIHNNICMLSVFINKAGEWKLGGLDYIFPSSESPSPPIKILPYLDKYDPPERKDSNFKNSFTKWSTDMWGLGCLIWEVFNGPLSKPSSLRNVEKIPKSLVSNYCELVGANPAGRPTPSLLLSRCEAKGGFFNNIFVNTLLFLEEIQIKETLEKTKFFNNLTAVLDNFPPEISKYKILPQLLCAFEFGNAGSAVLSPIFKLGKLLDADEYQKKIVPCVVKLFSSTDRATRARLLQQMEYFVDHLQPALVNDQIFPQVIQGFMDTNPTIRETTVKAMLHLASKLNYNNLNVELMKHFARLQAKDEQGGVRTNTTICLGKVAPYLHPQTRQKVLVAAFTRATRDPFPPARTAGIMALAATQSYYPLQDVGTKVIPVLSPLCLDSEKAVRDQAFKVIKGFLSKLERVSEDPSVAAELEMEVNVVNSPTMVDTAASWAGWAVSSLTSKFYKSEKVKPTSSNQSVNDSNDVTSKTNVPREENTASKDHDRAQLDHDKQKDGSDIEDDEDDWNDDWGEMDSTLNKSKSQEPVVVSGSTEAVGVEGNDWEDWSAMDDISESSTLNENLISSKNEPEFVATDPSLKPASMYNWGDTHSSGDQFFANNTSLARSSITTNKSGSQFKCNPVKETAIGWDCEDDTNWETWEPKHTETSSKPSTKEQREEKRLQRQRELQEKRAARQTSGAMKLGERKKLPKP